MKGNYLPVVNRTKCLPTLTLHLHTRFVSIGYVITTVLLCSLVAFNVLGATNQEVSLGAIALSVANYLKNEPHLFLMLSQLAGIGQKLCGTRQLVTSDRFGRPSRPPIHRRHYNSVLNHHNN